MNTHRAPRRTRSRSEREQQRQRQRQRHGFVLPLVVIATLLVALLAAGAQAAAWRATRAARQAWNGERALLAADEAVARLQAAWNPRTFATRDIGNRTAVQLATADGVLVDLQIARTHPLIAWVEASAASTTAGTPRPAQRRIARALQLQPPALPLGAALGAFSPVQLHAGAKVSGIDDITRVDACGPWRDSSSVAGMHANAPAVNATAIVGGAPPIRTPADSARDTRLWTSAWPTLQSRSVARTIPSGTGPAVLATPWTPILARDSMPITIAGALAHDGLLIIDGDVVITGALQLQGVLIVRGTIDARIGTLQIDGMLLVRSPVGALSHFGSGTIVRYSQCAMQRALAAVALPVTQPFALWSER